MDTDLLLALGIILLLAVIGLAVIARRRHSHDLRRRFGPEYERTVERTGNRGKAEADLLAREQRAASLDIVPLAAHEAQRFRMEWQALQTRFVDAPRAALGEADLLVRDVMLRRGYPMGDFESRAADISVDHPQVVEHYRAAHAIALRDQQETADTEALRQALVHYRALFSVLLEDAAAAAPSRRPPEERKPARTFRGILPPERALARDQAVTRDREPRGEARSERRRER
jgi:hypothetical protein